MATLALTTDVDDPIEVDVELEGALTLVPAVTPLPDEHPVWLRKSRVLPAPTIDPDTGQPIDWEPTAEYKTDLGHLQVVVDGRDLTYFRGKRTLITNWEIREPWGDWACEIVFPAITPHDHPGSGAVAWLHDGAHVGLREIQPEGSEAPNIQLWTGMVLSENSNYDEDNQVYRVTCGGALIQSDLAVQTAGYSLTERDIGYLIPLALNTVISRDYLTCPTIMTGITSRSRGSGSSRMAWISDLLATATTSDGLDQWTIHNFGWSPRLLLKNRTDVHVTMRAGQAGLLVDLTRDASTAPRVIYGEGTRNDGMRWKNTKHPGARLTAAPVFPLDPDDAFTPGGADTGFAEFAQEMRDNGYRMYSGNAYDARDADEVRDAQRRGGVAVTGNVGATTWATLFAVGSSGGNLGNAYQAPVSIISEVDPWTYNAVGAITGKNPDYDPFLLRVERYENFGEGVDLAHARSSARGELNRTNLPVWSGTITLKADPNEMSRWRIRAGMNFLLQGHHQIDRQLHIAGVDAQWASGTVVLTVDQANRDLLTLRELHDRNKDSATDPTRRPGNLSTRRRSRDIVDTITVWDGETGAGRVDLHAAAGGEWLVYKVRAGQVGTLSHITFRTTDPMCEFAIGMFGKPVTSTQLTSLVGNPLTNSKPWDPSWDALYNLGLFAAWGGSDTPCGYSPGNKTDGDELTGRLIDGNGVPYFTDFPGWIWVAEFVEVGCYMRGQINAEPEGV